eukprot:5827367-Pyramimonas_sp.AAC.1
MNTQEAVARTYGYNHKAASTYDTFGKMCPGSILITREVRIRVDSGWVHTGFGWIYMGCWGVTGMCWGRGVRRRRSFSLQLSDG